MRFPVPHGHQINPAGTVAFGIKTYTACYAVCEIRFFKCFDDPVPVRPAPPDGIDNHMNAVVSIGSCCTRLAEVTRSRSTPTRSPR